MDHVPTLCAIGTVGIAATGFALGRQEQTAISSPMSNKRKAPGFSDTIRSYPSPGNISSTTRPMSTTPPSFPVERPTDASAHRNKDDRTMLLGKASDIKGLGIDNGQTPDTLRHRRPTSNGDVSARIRAEQTPSSEVKGTVKSSSSWLRRISTISSQNESPTSSPRPDSPSISFSNGSTAPMIPSSNISPASLPPNKLVKRTTSHRALSANHIPTSEGRTTSQVPAFRRPATSHQRSATLRQQRALDENIDFTSSDDQIHPPPAFEPIRTPESSTAPVWRPYFSRGYSKAAHGQPRKRHTSGYRGSSVNRILKDADDLPTLLLATSITPRISEDDLDDVGDRNFSFTKTWSETPPDTQTPHSKKSLPTCTDPGDRKARHSFSITDMFVSSSPSSWKMPRSESLRRKKRNTGAEGSTTDYSSPLPTTARSSKSNKAFASPGRLQRRRNVTDPTLFQPPHNVQTTFSSADSPGHDPMEGITSSPLPSVARLSAFEIDLPGGAPSYPSTPYSETRSSSHNLSYFPPDPVSSPLVNTASRPKRLSMATSDPASTLIGSDNDTRGFASGEEDEMDFQSDTAFDSLATRATASSNSGVRGPRIETIFDESPPPELVKDNLVALKDLIPNGSFSEHLSTRSSKQSMLEEEAFSTPIRQVTVEDEDYLSTPIQVVKKSAEDINLPSSPPLYLGSVEHATGELHASDQSTNSTASVHLEGSDKRWEYREEMDMHIDEETSSPELPKDSGRRVSPSNELQLNLPPEDVSRLSTTSVDKEVKSSLFDWSEQQKSEKDSLQGSGPRPKTVHGKQGADGRGSRAPGRRGPSALHLRSQSVPVSRESTLQSDPYYPAAKFGTWGLGNKGVSEDWNDDFDFEEPDELSATCDPGGEAGSTNDAQGMKVPRAIMERQASVHGQFGQVQELTLLVEELKRLRAQASLLEIMGGPSSELWKEAEGIINLATLDDGEKEFAPPRSPSSPGFNFDVFDDDSSPAYRSGKRSLLSSETESTSHANTDVDAHQPSVPITSAAHPSTPPPGRPRKQSSAKAKSVLETIYQQRGGFEPVLNEMKSHPQKKLPFDTQSLRDLVVRARVVTRALKEIVRKAEGVIQSPDQSPNRPQDPPFSQIFTQPSDESPTFRKSELPKSRSASGYLGSSIRGNESDIAGHMKLMTVV